MSAPSGIGGSQSGANFSSNLEVDLKDDGGGDLLVMAVVTLSAGDGRMVKQSNTEGGRTEFDGLAPGRYSIQVTAPGYESVKQPFDVTGLHPVVNVPLRRKPVEDIEQAGATGVGGSAVDAFWTTTAVKEQRQILKIAQALREKMPQKAGVDLAKLYLDNSSDVNLNYLYGIYEKEMNDLPKAKFYLRKVVGLDPKNLGALMELGHTALDEGKPEEALPYLKRAAQVSPTSWHPHALMLVAYSRQKEYRLAIQEAERALELGHSQAAALVQPALASALAAEGNKEQAIQILRDYVQNHPDAEDAKNLLAALREPGEIPWPVTLADPAAPTIDLDPMLPSAWMPSRVDDKVPPVESGVPCSLDTVLTKASARMSELVQDLERFEATEFLEHQRIGKQGLPSQMETRTYRYMVAIEEVQPGLLAVSELRNDKKEQEDPPDGLVTSGLPGMALVFHPAQIGNFKFTCEGLSRSNGGLAWQVYFQQRPDRIPTLHGYRWGDQVRAVALKGRAWIAADTFQIVRLESDLMEPYPEIRLTAEHTQVEYGPVRFRSKNVNLWLPQKAEVYFDWRGKRVHRLLSYSNYSLFSVESTQKIKPPKNAEKEAPDSPEAPAPVKPN